MPQVLMSVLFDPRERHRCRAGARVFLGSAVPRSQCATNSHEALGTYKPLLKFAFEFAFYFAGNCVFRITRCSTLLSFVLCLTHASMIATAAPIPEKGSADTGSHSKANPLAANPTRNHRQPTHAATGSHSSTSSHSSAQPLAAT